MLRNKPNPTEIKSRNKYLTSEKKLGNKSSRIFYFGRVWFISARNKRSRIFYFHDSFGGTGKDRRRNFDKNSFSFKYYQNIILIFKLIQYLSQWKIINFWIFPKSRKSNKIRNMDFLEQHPDFPPIWVQNTRRAS